MTDRLNSEPSPHRQSSHSSSIGHQEGYPKSYSRQNHHQELENCRRRIKDTTDQSDRYLRQRNEADIRCGKFKRKLNIMCNREKVLMQSLEAYTFLQNNADSQPIYLPNSYTKGFQPKKEDNTELMAAILRSPCTNDKSLITQILASVHLNLEGNSSYVQSELHPQVPTRELFSSNKVNEALTTLLGGKDKAIAANCEALRMIIASSATIAIELLRACELVQMPSVKLPVGITPDMWIPEALSHLTPKSPIEDTPLALSQSKDVLKTYLEGALQCVSSKKIVPITFSDNPSDDKAQIKRLPQPSSSKYYTPKPSKSSSNTGPKRQPKIEYSNSEFLIHVDQDDDIIIEETPTRQNLGYESPA